MSDAFSVNDEPERSGGIRWVCLGSVVKAAGLGGWALPLSLVGAADVGPRFCKAWDKLCNFAKSNCAADTPEADAGTGVGAGLWEIGFVSRCGFSAPSVRNSIEDKTVEEDRVARALDIFDGGADVGVWLSL